MRVAVDATDLETGVRFYREANASAAPTLSGIALPDRV
jgi:hypothetical protein